MAIAAVPRYLGNDFSTASPGMRFSYFLGIWTTREDQVSSIRKRSRGRSREAVELAHAIEMRGIDAVVDEWIYRKRLPGLWEKNEEAARQAWGQILKLNAKDKDVMTAMVDRQNSISASLEAQGQLLRLDALAVAPFSTGLGNEHPLENGFSFLNPYGLPYLPGSGVKGVLRQAARELKSGEWGDTAGWDDTAIAALFGKEGRDGDTDHQRGALMFWDVIPQLKGATLQVEVMTPHQTHYYQRGETPHESGSPNPIDFLTVPPGSGFVFHVQCDRPFLARIAPRLTKKERWKELLIAAFEHAFAWLGFGAKTAVGYGALERDTAAEEEARTRAAEEAERLRREGQELARRQAEEREAARRKAEYDAKSESEKAIIGLKRQFAAFAALSDVAKRQERDRLQGSINAVLVGGPGWESQLDREEAASLIERIYDEIGWHDQKAKGKDKRKKQEDKRRKRIANLRGATAS